MDRLRILSLNVRGLGGKRKVDLVMPVMKQWSVVFLQETFVDSQSKMKRCMQQWSGEGYWGFGGGKCAGVGILINEGSDLKVLEIRRDIGGRAISLLVRWGSVRYTFLCVYAPTGILERREFFNDLGNFIFPNTRVVMGGDFNCVCRGEDTTATTSANRLGSEELSQLVRERGFEDVWMAKGVIGSGHTWRGQGVCSRLDRFYIDRTLLDFVDSCAVKILGFSDHDGVEFSLKRSNERLPSTLWKFNNGLLESEHFVTRHNEWVKKRVSKWDGQDVHSFWTSFKKSVRSKVRRFSAGFAKERRKEREKLVKRIVFLRRKMEKGEDHSAALSSLEGELRSLTERENEGAKIRSRAQWIEEGEKPTRYFFKLCSSHRTGNYIEALKDGTGQKISEEGGKRVLIENFYRDLFTKEQVDIGIQDSLLEKVRSCVTNESRDRCEGPIGCDELAVAMRGMKTGKTPGEDGLTLEYFKTFGEHLLPVLSRLANESYEKGFFPQGCVTGVIRLAFKKGDRSELKNWRPISLLNVDYKIISKALSIRLRASMAEIINEDQTCSVVGRTISDNLNLVRDVLSHIDQTGEGGIMISLDQEKAFDRVDRIYLDRVLDRFGFGQSFRRWMKVLYQGAVAKVICNNFLTEQVELGRGIRQGCALSPMLYVLLVETLACNIRNDPSISGFLVPGSDGKQTKTFQYADDLLAIVRNLSSVAALLDVVEVFGLGTGARLNRGKSEARWIGRHKDRQDKPFGLKWVVKMKVLGVWFGDNVEDENWVSKMRKMRQVVGLWSTRSLSIRGRVLIVKALLLSKLDYVARVQVPPRTVIPELKSIIWPFVWGGKTELVKRETCVMEARNGGVGMVDVEARFRALRIANVVRILEQGEGKAFSYLAYYLGIRLSSLREDWMHLRSNSRPNALRLSSYYQSVYDDMRHMPDDCSISLRKVYGTLIERSVCPPRCMVFWNNSFWNVNWKRVWTVLVENIADNRVSEVRWRIIHRVIKVRQNLKDWGYNVTSTKCASCNEEESIEHCFMTCERLRKVWEWVGKVVGKWNVNFSVSRECLFLGSGTGRDRALMYFIIDMVLYSIWKCRNLATFRNKILTSRQAIEVCRVEITMFLRADMLRRGKDGFEVFWGAGDAEAVLSA